MDPEYLTVQELAALLRVKDRKVYDLAASGEVPCSRATGKLLFPAAEIRNWIDGAKSGGAARAARPQVILGSHDPLFDWAIRQSGCGFATYCDGSHDGLTRFCRGEGVAAALHLFDPLSGAWNQPFVKEHAQGQDAALIRIAVRERGIVCNRAAGINGLQDLKGHSIVPRQPQAGTSGVFAHALEQTGLRPEHLTFSEVARTEDEAVQAVQRGDAAATFGLGSVARMFGLSFLPMVEEPFDLLIDRRAYFSPAFQVLLSFMTSDQFHARAQALGGYDVSDIGKVIWNAE